MKWIIFALLPIFIFSLPASARITDQGFITAKVIKVYDGDTITIQAYVWPGIVAIANVRVYGVDTPEIRGRCDAEKKKAIEARDFVRKLVLGKTVLLENVKYGKYAGRVVAGVRLLDGKILAKTLIEEDLGREYYGGKREGWCQ